jgi:hypothetical protein
MHGMPRKLGLSILLGGETHTHTVIYKFYYSSCTQKFSLEHHSWKLCIVLKKLGLDYKDEV